MLQSAELSCLPVLGAIYEVFTYIDRVVADKATFLLWLDEQQKAAESAATTLRQMREHPLFPSFCEAVNVTAEQWGQDGNPEHVATEVQFFNEWLAAKEIEQAVGPTFGVSAMDTMETQVDVTRQLHTHAVHALSLAWLSVLHLNGECVMICMRLPRDRLPRDRQQQPCRPHRYLRGHLRLLR